MAALDDAIAEIERQLAAMRGEDLDAIDVEPSNRFRIWSADEICAQPSPGWIVKRVLPVAELAVIYGEPGSGKSFLAFDLCCAIARGASWSADGLRVKRGRCVYVFAEGASGAKQRVMAYRRQHGNDVAMPGMISERPNLFDAKDSALLCRKILAQGGADVIVIDTLSAASPGADENAGRDLGKVIDHCKFLHAQTGALVVVVHHSGKDSSKGPRGWSGLHGAADAEIEVVRNGDYRLATVVKQKDGADGVAFGFKLKRVVVGLDEDGDEISSCVIEHVADAPREAKKLPQGIYASAIRHAMRSLQMFDGRSVPNRVLIDEARCHVPAPIDGKQDNRTAELNRKGIQALVKSGELELVDDGHAVRVCGPVEVSETDTWDQ